ncbi:MAG TPA: MFS transporter [Microbacteriaceae bacterium]|nr:MFS transporter [Microbacteriaceae bacterium]
MIKRIVALTGVSYFPIALIARLPFAMMVVGVLTLVVATSGSLLLGGVNSALVGAGTAIFGPLIGAAADRFGQRPVLLLVGSLNALFLLAFVFIVWSSLPIWVMLSTAFLIGASAPQVSAMSRSRMVGVATEGFEPQDRDRVLGSVMAYESTVDETVFVFGPFIVGLIAILFGSSAPVVAAAILTIVFVSLFALHRSAKPAISSTDRAATLAPVSELFKLELLVTIAGIFGIGLFFGSMLTSLTAFMQELGDPEQTGILYGVMGVGSAALALAVAFFPPAFTKRWRWLLFALLMLIGAFMLQNVSSKSGMMFALAIIGLGIGPILVTQYSFGADRSPIGRNATVMTTMGSAIIVGQSLSSALAGWLSEDFGVKAALLMPLSAVLVVLITGILNFFLTPSGRQLSRFKSTI